MGKRSEAPTRVADRPHFVTILIGILSPTLAVAALYMSFQSISLSRQSLEQSKRAMEVGQQAYFAIEQTEAIVAKTATNEYRFSFTFNVKNQGNTPGTIVAIRYRYEADANDGMVSPYSLPRNFKTVFEGNDSMVEDDDVGPKLSTKRKTETIVVNLLHPDLWMQKSNSWLPIRLIGTLTYQDVFQQQHTITWCWRPMTAQKEPMRCTIAQ